MDGASPEDSRCCHEAGGAALLEQRVKSQGRNDGIGDDQLRLLGEEVGSQ